MESLLHRQADPSSSSSHPTLMASTNEIFSFMDLPFFLNSPTSLDHLLPPSLSPQPLHTMHQEPIIPSPPPSMIMPSPSNPSSKKRGSRKRARSSQRAPTTVMVTNRCNFRAMVQEFTGFPAAHYSSPQLPGSQFGLLRSIPGSSDFNREFPALSSFLLPERNLPPSSGGMISRRMA